MNLTWTAEEVVAQISSEGSSGEVAWIDVRSEGEFLEGALPAFVNLPVLNNQERHLVGTAYKKEGQEKAIRLGHQLVGPSREARLESWTKAVRASSRQQAGVLCWRGGLRSGISCQWLREKLGEAHVFQVRGGYKAVRRIYLHSIGRWASPKLNAGVLTGGTGSGKSRLIQKYRNFSLDLEGLAAHRGSAFGRLVGGTPQPHQATFENHVGKKLYEFLENQEVLAGGIRIWLEDEAPMIGDIRLPDVLLERIRSAPVVELVVPLEDRVANIIDEYIRAPILDRGVDLATLAQHFSAAVLRIRKALGSERAAKLEQKIQFAFGRQASGNQDFSIHEDWVRFLLSEYYDPRYVYGIQKLQRPTLFRGTLNECDEYLRGLRGVR